MVDEKSFVTVAQEITASSRISWCIFFHDLFLFSYST
jgi:hypothetical protein